MSREDVVSTSAENWAETLQNPFWTCKVQCLNLVQIKVCFSPDVLYFICITESLTHLVVAQDHAVTSAVQIQGGENPHKCT